MLHDTDNFHIIGEGIIGAIQITSTRKEILCQIYLLMPSVF